MSNTQFSRFFRRITHAVMTPLLTVSLALCLSVYALSPEEAVSVYHAYPYMLEHILCGLAVYLAFSLIITKIHRSSLHD